MTGLPQKWVNTPASNYGVILWATNEDSAGYTMRFHSSEAANQSDRPYLEVVYSTEATTRTVYFLKDHLGSIRATVLYTGESFFFGLRKRNDEVSWVNDITKRVSERKPELKPFVRSTR